MKNLELTRMESIDGGGDCTERAVLLGLGIGFLAVATVASGGLITLGVGMSMFSSAAAFGAMVESGECF